MLGFNVTTGSNNIEIGNSGLAGDPNTIRIGKPDTQVNTFVAGISGVPVTGAQVVVNSTGKLGVAVSSARFKAAVKSMETVSEVILALKAVTFRYNQQIDPSATPAVRINS
jgi:hypothetical protein